LPDEILNCLSCDSKEAKLSKNEGIFDVGSYQGLLIRKVEKLNTSKFTDAINDALFTWKQQVTFDRK
jgi:hypothetical protein